jgi:hypothetical protein
VGKGKKRAFYALKGIFRGLRILLAVGLILLVAAFFGAKHLFDEERVRSLLVTQLQEVFHRPVQIGAVVLTPSGIKLRDLKIIERLDVPGQHLLTSEVVIVTLQLRPLLRRRLKLDNVKLLSPRIQFIRDADGLWNVADIFTSTAARRSPAPDKPPLPLSLAAENTIIEGGFVMVEDRFKRTSHRFDKVNLTVRKFDTEKPFTFSASFDNVNAVSSRTIHTDWKMKGSMSLASFDWPLAYLRAERIEVSVDDNLIRGSGGLTGFKQASADFDVTAPALGPAVWQSYLGKPLDLNLPPSRWRLKLSFQNPGKIEVKRLQVNAFPLVLKASGLLDFSTGGTTVEALVETEAFPLVKAASMRRSWEPFQLAGTAQGQFMVHGTQGGLQVTQADLVLRDLAATFPKATVLGGDVTLNASQDFSNIRITARKGLVNAYGHSFRDLSGAMTLIKGDLKLESLTTRWNDSTVKLKARVLNVSDPKEVAVAGSVDRMRWENAQSLIESAISSTKTSRPGNAEEPKPWVRIFKYTIPKKFPDILGEISIGSIAHRNFSFKKMVLLWNVRGISPALNHVSGDIKVGFGPGRVNDIPAVQDAHKLLRIVFLPFIYMHKMNNLSVFSAATAYPKTLDFTRIEGEYGIRSGVATTRCFYVDSPQVVAYADGTADLGKERVDMNILTRLTSYKDPLPEWWTDELGRPAIGFHVRNDLNKPDLDPRLSKMGANEIERAVGDCKARSKLHQGALAKARDL